MFPGSASRNCGSFLRSPLRVCYRTSVMNQLQGLAISHPTNALQIIIRAVVVHPRLATPRLLFHERSPLHRLAVVTLLSQGLLPVGMIGSTR
jgi:hypothetical protein